MTDTKPDSHTQVLYALEMAKTYFDRLAEDVRIPSKCDNRAIERTKTSHNAEMDFFKKADNLINRMPLKYLRMLNAQLRWLDTQQIVAKAKASLDEETSEEENSDAPPTVAATQ